MLDRREIGIANLMAAIEQLKARVGEDAFLRWAFSLPVNTLVSNRAYLRAIQKHLGEME